MANLSWLKTRIWIALALPAGACGGKDKGPEQPDPDVGNTSDAGVAETPPATNAEWTVVSSGCGGAYWCAQLDECPAQVTIAESDDGPPAGTYEASGDQDGCCFNIPYDEPCLGRPFLDGDRKVVAEAVAKDGWAAAALEEHASIASFARATLELMAVGAPPDLIAGCQHAALDEIAHAQGCLAMAARHGCAVEPGPIEALAPRGGGLAAVARDTFLEGCVGETLGALQAANARDAAQDPDERALLTRIADDEARHAELAWKTVAWAVSKDPSIVSSLRAAADRARTDAPVWRDVIDPALSAVVGA